MSSLIFLYLPFFFIDELFHLSDDTLISTTFSSLFFNLFFQKSDCFFILLLFICIDCNLSIHLVSQFDFLIKNFLHFLKFSFINHTLSSFFLDCIFQITNFIIMFHSNSVVFKKLFLSFLDQSFILSDCSFISKTFVSFFLKLFSHEVQLFFIF